MESEKFNGKQHRKHEHSINIEWNTTEETIDTIWSDTFETTTTIKTTTKRSATEVKSQAATTHIAKRKQPINLIDASIESATEKGVEMETKVNDNHYDGTEDPKVTD